MPNQAGQHTLGASADSALDDAAIAVHDSDERGGDVAVCPHLSFADADVSTLMDLFAHAADERAFEEIVRRYSGMVHAVCSQVTHNAHDAEDATQAVFLTLALELRGAGDHRNGERCNGDRGNGHRCNGDRGDRRHRGAPIRSLGAWLQQVAHRVSLDLCKSRRRRIAREDRCRQMKLSDNRTFPAADDSIDQDELKVLLRDELNQLPTRYRTPMILYYFGGMTPVSIARQLGCRPKALGMRLFRGRKMLAEQLAGRGLPVGAAALAVAMASALSCAVQHGVTDALAGASAAAAGSGAGAGATFGFNITSGFTAGPAFGPSLGVGNAARDFAPMFLRLARAAAGSGVKLSGRAKIAMGIALLIASGVGGSSQLVRDAVGAAGHNWIGPVTSQIGEQFRRLIRSLPGALPKPTMSVSSATPAPSATPATSTRRPATPLDRATFATASPLLPLNTGYAVAPNGYALPRFEVPSFDPQPARPPVPATFQLITSSFGESAASSVAGRDSLRGDPFRLPSHQGDSSSGATARVFASASAPSAMSNFGASADDDHDDPVANHAIAAINRWMFAANDRTGGSRGSGEEHVFPALSNDALPALSAEEWLARLVRMASRDERFSLVDPQTLADLAARAAQDGWDWRVLTANRLAIALGLADDVPEKNTNAALSIDRKTHTSPVPEPGAISLIALSAAAGTLLRRRRRPAGVNRRQDFRAR